ncbi:MAG: hypothetical protein KC609_13975, partial [Myxococcales bacterium]|nr:hypothetical protein [Myxococcales bacterium]
QRLLGQVGEIAAQEEDLSSLSALATALVTPTFEIRALVGRAHFLIDARDAYAEAQESAERALALARLHHLPDQSARALEAIGAACLASTNYRRAEEVLEEARRTWDAISPRSGDGLRAATTLAEVYFRSASRQRAQDLLEVVREQAKEGGNTLLLHDASLLLAGIARRRARYDDAIELGETARALAQQAGEKRREARSTMALALYLWLARQYRRSHEMFLAALEIARQLGNRRSMLYTAMNLAELYVEVGRYDDARALLARGRAQLKHVDSLSLELYYLATQVLLELGAGSDEGARSAAELVIQLPARPGFRMELAWLHYVLGRSALARGELDGARDHLANASALYDATDDWENASAAQAYLGYCHQLLGDADTALALTSAAYDSALTHGQGEAIQAVFYVHARVLESLGHVGPASEALQRAYDAVRHQTGALPEGWEDAFERDVPINRAILECYRSQRRCLTVSLPVAAPRGANTRREVTLEWTLSAPGDQAYTRKPERRQHRLRRLLDEDRAAGAAPSAGDLARALSVSERTVERDLAVLRRDQS